MCVILQQLDSLTLLACDTLASWHTVRYTCRAVLLRAYELQHGLVRTGHLFAYARHFRGLYHSSNYDSVTFTLKLNLGGLVRRTGTWREERRSVHCDGHIPGLRKNITVNVLRFPDAFRFRYIPTSY